MPVKFRDFRETSRSSKAIILLLYKKIIIYSGEKQTLKDEECKFSSVLMSNNMTGLVIDKYSVETEY